MPGLAGSITALGLLGVASLASPGYHEPQAVSDTWSLSISDSATVDATTPPTEKIASDTWSLTLTETDSVIGTYPAQLTDRSLLAVAGRWVDIEAKPYVGTNTVHVSDTWSLTWTEEPTNELTIDTWDIWRLAWNELAPSLSISQTFAASDTWSLGWLDVASVLAGGALPIEPTDTWSLQFTDDATVAATVEATDDWSLQFTDGATVEATSDTQSATDTWSITLSVESVSIGVVADIPILASDEWRLVLAETASVSTLTSAVSALRIVRVPRRTIIVRPK